MIGSASTIRSRANPLKRPKTAAEETDGLIVEVVDELEAESTRWNAGCPGTMIFHNHPGHDEHHRHMTPRFLLKLTGERILEVPHQGEFPERIAWCIDVIKLQLDLAGIEHRHILELNGDQVLGYWANIHSDSGRLLVDLDDDDVDPLAD